MSIVVATYNRARMLDQCIDALLGQELSTNVPWEIVIVDNNSADATRDIVARWTGRTPVPLRYVFEARQGKSAALNAGIRAAHGSILAFTDDDVEPPSEWISEAIHALDRWDADIVGGRILPKWESPPPRWLELNRRYWGALALTNSSQVYVLALPLRGHPGQIWGGNMVCRRSVFDHIGLFNTGLGPVGDLAYKSEDMDLVTRALSAGLRAIYDPTVTVFHRVPRTRMTWRYVCRWHWLAGESETVQAGILLGRYRLLGVPFWSCRHAARLFARCLSHWALLRPSAADDLLELMQVLGRLRGYHLLWLRQRRGGPRCAPERRSP